RETIVHQQVERYARSWVHQGPWYQYFADFTTGFLPWSLFIPGALWLAWLTWRDAQDHLRAARAAAGNPDTGTSAPFLLPLSWFAAGFVFFSLSTGKRAAYLLPLYPAAALLVGWFWASTVAQRRASRWLTVPAVVLASIGALLAGILAVHGLGG